MKGLRSPKWAGRPVGADAPTARLAFTMNGFHRRQPVILDFGGLSMGVAFYPVFEDGTGGWPEDMNGKCLASAATRLDRAINHTGVGSIFNYFSPTRDQSICELPDADPDDPTTFDEADVPPESWFEVEAGLRTIREMLSHVRNGDEKIEVIECVREDLEVFERLLVDAATRGVRWHLVIDA